MLIKLKTMHKILIVLVSLLDGIVVVVVTLVVLVLKFVSLEDVTVVVVEDVVA